MELQNKRAGRCTPCPYCSFLGLFVWYRLATTLAGNTFPFVLNGDNLLFPAMGAGPFQIEDSLNG